MLATEVEKENLQQLKLAKYFSIILDCIPDMSHREQMSVILRYVLCNEEAAVETVFGYLRISESTGKGLLDAFLEKKRSNCNSNCLIVKASHMIMVLT